MGKKIELHCSRFMQLLLKSTLEKKIIETNRKLLNAHQNFILEMFIKARLIMSTLDSLDLNIKYISEFDPLNSKKGLSDLTVNDINKLKYHFENFYFRIAKVKDQILLLINHQFELKLKSINCNYDNVCKELSKQIKNDKESDDEEKIRSLLIHLIKSHKSKFKQLNDIRNEVMHSTEYIEEDFDILKALLMMQDAKKTEAYKDLKFNDYNGFDEKLLDTVIFKKLFEFREIYDALNQWCFAFYEINYMELKINLQNAKPNC